MFSHITEVLEFFPRQVKRLPWGTKDWLASDGAECFYDQDRLVNSFGLWSCRQRSLGWVTQHPMGAMEVAENFITAWRNPALKRAEKRAVVM